MLIYGHRELSDTAATYHIPTPPEGIHYCGYVANGGPVGPPATVREGLRPLGEGREKAVDRREKGEPERPRQGGRVPALDAAGSVVGSEFEEVAEGHSGDPAVVDVDGLVDEGRQPLPRQAAYRALRLPGARDSIEEPAGLGIEGLVAADVDRAFGGGGEDRAD